MDILQDANALSVSLVLLIFSRGGLSGVDLSDSFELVDSGLNGVLSSTSLSGVFEITGSSGLLHALACGDSHSPGLEFGGVLGAGA